MNTLKMSKKDDDLKYFLIDMLPVIITGLAIIIMYILKLIYTGN